MTQKSIDLAKTLFDMSAVVSTAWEPKIDTMIKGKWSRVNDFGTIFIGCDPNEELGQLILGPGDLGPVFVAPPDWRMPHVLKAFGVFSSTSQAAKNGWNKDIPFGLSEWHLKISRCFGCLHIFKQIH